MTNFFISYNQADRAWAEWIAWQLEEEGYSTYLQAWDSRPAENFVIKMNEAIRDSERMIAVLSSEYLNSYFSSPEWASAFAEDPKGDKGTLLPVRIRECDLRGLFKSIGYIDLVGKNEAEAKDALLSGVQRKRAKPLTKPEFPNIAKRLIPEPPSFPGASAKKSYVKWLAALVVFFILIVGGLYAFSPSWQPPRSCLKSSSGDTQYYEAEDAELWGGASKDSEHLGFSGDGFVSGYGAEPDAMTTFWVDIPTAGEYQIDLCYANATNSAKMLSIYVNERRIKQTRLANAPRWNIWLTQHETLRLIAGRNAISYRKTPGDTGQVNLDFIGIPQKPSLSYLLQPTTTPVPSSRSIVRSPSPTPALNQTAPTEDEMKDTVLRELEKRGAQRKDSNTVVIDNVIAGMTIKIETFVKLGCKPANYGVGYECTYTITLSHSFHSNDETVQRAVMFENLNRVSPGIPDTVTRKFVRSSEGWLMVRD